jgi:carbamoyltransferase
VAVIGISDSYDSGCALVDKGTALSALNEERFTKNKNETGFPSHSLRFVLKEHDNQEIQAVALGWIGGNALVSRIIPSWDRRRRLLWRRELPKPSRMRMHAMNLTYRLSQGQWPKVLWRAAGKGVDSYITSRRLGAIDSGLAHKKIYVIEHHLAHASAAYYSSGFKEALVVTLDGAGDGLSGTVSIGDNGEIKRLAEFRASSSLGIMYGAATLACDMRYSEDEGKLMSLAAYSYPAEIKELNDLCRYDHGKKQLVSKIKTRNEFLLSEYIKDHILGRYNREAFAYAIQSHAEKQVMAIVNHWISETNIHNVALGGGFFSNVIANMKIERMKEVKNLFVFPHMGDGGLSFGAAMYVDHMLNGSLSGSQMGDLYLGPSYDNASIEAKLKEAKAKGKLEYEEVKDPAAYGAELVADDNEIMLWFQGCMEYGPRALGNRSVISMPDSQENRDRLNLIIKKRPYYQPFASTILEEDAEKLLSDYTKPNRFMTGANMVREEHHGHMAAASHVDHSTRPQILGNENLLYRRLIERVRKKTGIGAVLNTSLNKHGMPMVLSPEDAIWTLENTGAEVLVIGDYVARKSKHGR